MLINSSNLLRFNTSLQLIIIFIGTLLFGKAIPLVFQEIFYSISLTIKDFLLFILPVIVFSYLFSSLLTLKGFKGIALTITLFIVVCISNYFSTLIAYMVASLKVINLNIAIDNSSHIKELLPLWSIKFPTFLTNNHALCFGLLLGIVFSFSPNNHIKKFSVFMREFSNFLLNKCFIPIVPFFVLGFILKMQYEGVLTQVIKDCLSLLLLISLTSILYLAFLLALASRFRFNQWLKYIKNVMPAAIAGFSTMSSLAAMPLTLKAIERNIEDPDIARVIIPSTVNIHTIGLAINIPLMALSLLSAFHHELPSFVIYNQFALSFILAQLAVAATPGFGILLMLPLLETYFHFTGEMSVIITTLYVLFDSFETSMNIFGNSALAIMFSKAYGKLNNITIFHSRGNF